MTDTPAAAGTPRTSNEQFPLLTSLSHDGRLVVNAAFACELELERELSAVQLLREAADRTINRQYEQLSACRAELAKERGQATRMMNYWIYERFGNDSGSGADEELATWVDGLKAKAERAEESERLLAAVEKDAARLAEEWKRECSDADQILLTLGLNPNSFRSEGGSLMLSKIVTVLAGKEPT